MSSPAPQRPEKKGLGKVLSRMKTVLRRDKGKSISLPPAAPAVEPSSTAAAEPALEPGVTKIPRLQIHEERARKLGAKFGLEITPQEWHSTEGFALRVEKPIRMRVRRTCHECSTAMGSSKECPKCKHPRCAKCPRYPSKRTEEQKQASRDRKAAAAKKQEQALVPDTGHTPKKGDLIRPSRNGGRDVVYKKPRQRVRRTCHQCKNLFATGSRTCTKCGHVRCTDCPRDPSKKNKYPLGYPGDEFGPSAVPQYTCLACGSLFPPKTGNGTPCHKCKVPKSDSCPRAMPRKIEPDPDPVILKVVEDKLASMNIT